MFIVKLSILLSVFSLSFSCFATGAEEKEVESKKENPAEYPIIDTTHKFVSNSILLVTNRIDRFFGSKRADDEANGSTLRTSWQYIKSEYSESLKQFNVRYNLKFPKLQEKLKFKYSRPAKKQDIPVESQDQKPLKQESTENSDEKATSPVNEQESRVKRLIDYTEFWNVRLESGVEANIPINPFINLRLWRPYSGKIWELNPTHEFFLFWEQGFGTRHSFNVDFKLSEKTILRIENVFTWTDEVDTITSSHGPSLFHTITDRRAISFHLKAHGTSRPNYFISNYQISAGYRQLIYKNWFYYEISPALNFPSDRDFERIASVLFKLEAVFGSI